MMRVVHTLCILCSWLRAVGRAESVLSLKMWRVWRKMRLWYERCNESKVCGRLCMMWECEVDVEEERRGWKVKGKGI